MSALLTFDACKNIDIADNRIAGVISEPLTEINEASHTRHHLQLQKSLAV
jgi:hypothetical protein